MIRIIIKVEHYGPDGNALAPTYRTVDITDLGMDAELKAALKPPHSYATCTIVGAEDQSAGKSK